MEIELATGTSYSCGVHLWRCDKKNICLPFLVMIGTETLSMLQPGRTTMPFSWTPFTRVRPGRKFQSTTKSHLNDDFISPRQIEEAPIHHSSDHDGTKYLSDSSKAPKLPRRQWLIAASCNAVSFGLDAREAAAGTPESLYVQPTFRDLGQPNASTMIAPTGIQAVRTPSINRYATTRVHLRPTRIYKFCTYGTVLHDTIHILTLHLWLFAGAWRRTIL